MSRLPIPVVISGFTGKLGSALLEAILADPELSVALGLTRKPIENGPFPQAIQLPKNQRLKGGVFLEVAHHEGAIERIYCSIEAGLMPVIGVTGFSTEELDSINGTLIDKNLPGLYVPNFAVGAVLMMKFAEMAAHYFPDVEIIEMHHEQKQDAPSGTAMMTLDRINQSRKNPISPRPSEVEKLQGARGATNDGTHVHSVRLPGLVAHQAVMFGATGEGLTIRHDAYNRSCYGLGARLCIKEVANLGPGLHYGLDAVMANKGPVQ